MRYLNLKFCRPRWNVTLIMGSILIFLEPTKVFLRIDRGCSKYRVDVGGRKTLTRDYLTWYDENKWNENKYAHSEKWLLPACKDVPFEWYTERPIDRMGHLGFLCINERHGVSSDIHLKASRAEPKYRGMILPQKLKILPNNLWK